MSSADAADKIVPLYADTPARGPAVVVGVGGGIGGALARVLVAREYSPVFGLSRTRPENLGDDAPWIWLPADVTDEASLRDAIARIDAGEGLSRVVIATGILHAPGVTPERAVQQIDPDAFRQVLEVNTVGPIIAAKHLAPLLRRRAPSVLAVLSARVGSIGDNRLGGWYSYRASKAALNMLIRTLAIELERTHPLAVCVALHPGTVATGLSAPFVQRSPPGSVLTPKASAERLAAVMDALRPSDSGGLFAWDGERIVW